MTRYENPADDKKALRPSRVVFAINFLLTGNGVEAARRSGYQNPHGASHRLLQRSDVKGMIRSLRAHSTHQLIHDAAKFEQKTKAKAVASLCSFLTIKFESEGAFIQFQELEKLPPSSRRVLKSWKADNQGNIIGIHVNNSIESLSELARLAALETA